MKAVPGEDQVITVFGQLGCVDVGLAKPARNVLFARSGFSLPESVCAYVNALDIAGSARPEYLEALFAGPTAKVKASLGGLSEPLPDPLRPRQAIKQSAFRVVL